MTGLTVDYTPSGKVLSRFLRSNDFARVLTGPFGSGKTVACCVEIFRRACQQPPGPDAVRRSRWLGVRSTYPQLRRTTIATWRDWFPDRFGVFTWGPPPAHRIILPLDDGTVCDLDMSFVALDGPDAEANLRGFEGTGIWFNELKEIPKSVVDFALGRVGRYPAKRAGQPPFWYGIIADTNKPDSDSWLYNLAEEEQPDGWAFFDQPGGVIKVDGVWRPNPDAENLQYLPENYYLNQLAGQSEDYIRVYLGNEYGFAIDGKPVYPEFSDSVHTAPEAFPPVPNLPLYIGVDFGLTPAATVAQRTATGQWRVLCELVATDMGAVRFSRDLKAMMDAWFPEFQRLECFGDPAGDQRAQTDESTALSIMRKETGWAWRAAPTNDFTTRREAVAGALSRLVDGKPGLLISPAAKVLRKGMAGAYQFRRVKVAGERYADKPEKGFHSHVCEALQYLMLGAGEGRALTRRSHIPAAHRPQFANHRPPQDPRYR